MFDNLSYEPFKEPRGFLKVLQWIFAICAFATTVNFTTQPSVELSCIGNTSLTTTVRHTIEYPFDLDHDLFPINLNCPNVLSKLACGPVGNAKSDSQFFVTTGVLSFLYSTLMIGIYLFADKLYTENPRAPMWDFAFTLIFAVFYISGSAAWSHGLTGLRAGTNPNQWDLIQTLNGTIKETHHFCDNAENTILKCANIVEAEFGGIVISILFGFIDFILWAANLWFLYKETTWFDGLMQTSPSGNPGNSGA